MSPAEALNLLEMVLGWNNARLVFSSGRYNIVPSDQALAGNVAARTGAPGTARGFEVRTVPLKYVSATEMEKILKSYARPNAIVNVDNSRNVITVGGSRAELENYLRTIEVFDVGWLSGMLVGVFPLQSGKASKVVADLEKVFGEQSKSPVAGMFRFIPLEGANAVLVITSQANYLDVIQQWLDRIDSAGGSVQLYSSRVEVHQGQGPGRPPGRRVRQRARRWRRRCGRRAFADAGPGFGGTQGQRRYQHRDAGQLRTGTGSTNGTGSTGGTGGSLSLNQRQSGNAALTLQVDGDRVGVGGGGNQLHHRAQQPVGVEVHPRRDRAPRRDADAGAHRRAGRGGAS